MSSESPQTNMRLPDKAKLLLKDLARYRRLSIAKLVIALAEEEALRIRERSSKKEELSDPLKALESRVRKEGAELKTEDRASKLSRIYGDEMPSSFYEVKSEKEIIASFVAYDAASDKELSAESRMLQERMAKRKKALATSKRKKTSAAKKIPSKVRSNAAKR